MCPNCVTPWKCNGPHEPGPDPDPRSVLSVSLSGFPRLPNVARRDGSWHARAEEAATWRNAAKLVAMQALREHEYPQDFPLRKATLEVTVIGVKADPDGCVAALKPIFDGMVDAKVLMDDSWRTLDGLSIRHEDGERGVRVDVRFGRVA